MLQKHLADIMLAPTQSRRNCACFMPEGVVYLRLKADQHHHNPQQQHVQNRSGHHVFGRNRRSVTSHHNDTIVPHEIPHLLRLSRAIDWVDERLHAMHTDIASGQRRIKRDTTTATIDHIGTVIQEIQESLGQLETSFVEQHELAISAADAATSTSSSTGARCFIAPAGQVNCSEIVYADEKSWRKSRLQIDQLIQLLKTKIVNLKEMRKHLREHRPSAVGDELSSSEEFDAAGVEIDALEATTAVSTTPTTTMVPGRSSTLHRRPNNSGGTARITKLERVSPLTAAELNAFGRPAAGNNEVPMVESNDMMSKFAGSMNASTEELSTSSSNAKPHIRGPNHRQRNHNRTGQTIHRRRHPTVVDTPLTTSTTMTSTTTPVPIAAQSVDDHLPQNTTQLLAELLATASVTAESPPATDEPPHDATTRFSNELPQLKPLVVAPIELHSNQFVASHPEDCFCEPENNRYLYNLNKTIRNNPLSC